MILLDTTVLVYAVNGDAPQHPASRAVLDAALRRRFPAALVPQVLVEFYAVITSARRVERPLEPGIAWKEVAALRAAMPVLSVNSDALTALGELVGQRRAVGQDVFDLFLAAQMRAHRVNTICTYDHGAFEGVVGIMSVTPDELLRSLALPPGV